MGKEPTVRQSVLLVDSNEASAEKVEAHMLSEGLYVRRMYDVQSARLLLSQRSFDAILINVAYHNGHALDEKSKHIVAYTSPVNETALEEILAEIYASFPKH